jgi:hypothetical protein
MSKTNNPGKPSWKSLETWALLLAAVLETLHAAGFFPEDSIGAHVVAALAALFATLRTGLKASETKSLVQIKANEVKKN